MIRIRYRGDMRCFSFDHVSTNILYIIVFAINLFTAFAAYSAPPNPKLFANKVKDPFLNPMMSVMGTAQFVDPDVPRANYRMQDDGIEYILAIRIDFSDKPGQKPASVFDDAIFGTDGTSMKLYFEEVSYGQMIILPGYLGGVIPSGESWYRAKKKMSYYGAGTIMTERYRELAAEACAAADTEIDFSKYDRDGDGYLDHLFIIHSGDDEASTGIPEDIWSAEIDAVPGIYDGIAIQSAIIVAEDPKEDTINIGIYCHEFFHDFGAPDLYSYDYPVGHWCLMGMFGPYQGNGQYPSHISGYLKWDFDADLSNGAQGWIKPDSLTESNSYTIDSFELPVGDRLYKIDIPGNSKEYFLLENRNQYAGTIYDSHLPESGIVIWHIDENHPKSFSNPHRAWVEDPSDPYRQVSGMATKGAAYSADDGQISFTPATDPNSNTNDGNYSGIIITDIGKEGMSMPFTLFFGDTYEPNDTLDDAYGPIVYGKQYSSFIKDEQDIDYFKFTAEAKNMVLVYLENIPDNANYELHLFDSQERVIDSSYNKKVKSISFSVFNDGIYYISVSPSYGYSSSQPYYITIESSPLGLAPEEVIANSRVRPNPGPDSNGLIYFEYELLSLVESFAMDIYALDGSLIYSQTIQPLKKSISLSWDVINANIASGIYLYTTKIELDGKTTVKIGKFAVLY